MEPLRGVRESRESKIPANEKLSAANNFVAAITDRGVIVNKPEHLSAFTIDKDKIDFYKQAQVIAEKQVKSEKNRGKLLK